MGITICDFVLWPDTEGRRFPMLSRWRMIEQQTGGRVLGIELTEERRRESRT